MNGTFYGIGVGPGDPELITLKAVNLLKRVDVVIAPRTGKQSGSTALNIARTHLEEKTEILELVFPMVYDDKALNEAWQTNKTTILALLEQGMQVAFLTLGDPMLYSTYIYILRLLSPHKVNIETIPGITSFCAAGSRVGFPLAEGDDILTIIPATCPPERLKQALAATDNAVLMKVSKDPEGLLAQLQAQGLADNAIMVSKCGHPDESVDKDIRQLNKLKPTYLSTILCRKKPFGKK